MSEHLHANEPASAKDQPARRTAYARTASSGANPSGPLSNAVRRAYQDTSSIDISTAPAIVGDVLDSVGQPLPDHTRSRFEDLFDHDFAKVRVHNDDAAQQAATAVHAKAFAAERHIVFGKGQHAPDTPKGEALMAHELAHVVHQSSANSNGRRGFQREAEDGHRQHGATYGYALGIQSIQRLAQQHSRTSPPEKATVAFLLQQYPDERDAMLTFSQATWGEEYAAQVVSVETQTPAKGLEPSANSAPGAAGFTGTAIPKVEAKNLGDRTSTGISAKEEYQIYAINADPAQGFAPTPPGWVYNDGDSRDGGQRAVDKLVPPSQRNYVGTSIPMQRAPGVEAKWPDRGKTQDGVRTTLSVGTTRGAGTPRTTQGTVVGVVQPGADNSAAAKAAALAKYKAAADKELDAQIAALKLQNKHFAPMRDDVRRSTSEAKYDLETAKAELAAAQTSGDVDAIVRKHKLFVAPSDDTRLAASVTRTTGSNVGGLADNTAIYANNEKTAVQRSTPGIKTTTETTDKTRELSTKGLAITRATSNTTIQADGTTGQSATKSGLTGGITDPLKYNKSRTVSHQDDKKGHHTNWDVGSTIGDGLGGGTLRGSYNKLDPAKAPKGQTPDPNTAPDKSLASKVLD
ncbi:MAG: DUF4157 domain-containing protein, partial [Candidatus Nanopelagicales bacterium]